jgi:methylated-DNA-[protein]-cysteine S-methyltransferase
MAVQRPLLRQAFELKLEAKSWAQTAFARIGLNAKLARTKCHAMMSYCIFETAAGFCAIAWSALGVVRFQLPVKSADGAERLLKRRAPEATPAELPAEISAAIAAATRYFAGEETDFSGVRLDLGDQDALFKRIYEAARRIRWGRTTTYGALAKDIGAGLEVARDVGAAMAKNPVPLIIPCHRVLAAGGKVGGFSAAGGAATKMRMLELEGVRLAPPLPVQRSFAF